MTLNEYAYSLLNTVRPKLKDDAELDIRQIKTWIVDTRATFLRNELNTQKYIESSLTQTISSNNFSITRESENKDHFIYKSSVVIPEILKLISGPAIVRIGPEDITAPSFKFFGDIKGVAFAGNGRFNKHNVFVYLENNNLFFKTRDPLFIIRYSQKVSMTAVFLNPSDLSVYNSEDGISLYSDEYSPFPMNREIKTYIDTAIMQSKLAIVEQTVPDNVNDGNDNTEDRVGITAARNQRRR